MVVEDSGGNCLAGRPWTYRSRKHPSALLTEVESIPAHNYMAWNKGRVFPKQGLNPSELRAAQ